MALVNIDRHILSELADIVSKKSKIRQAQDKLFYQYRDLESKESALIAHLVGEVQRVNTQKDLRGTKEGG